MGLVTVAGTKASPGATLLVTGLAATWPARPGRRLLVVEADPAGGVLAARYEALRGECTLADAALRVRRGFRLDVVLGCSRRLWGWLPVVTAPLAPRPAYEALITRESPAAPTAAERLAVGLAGCPDIDVLVDVGRLTPQSPALPFVEQADVTLVVTGLAFEAVAGTLALLDDLRAVGRRGALVLVGVGPGPYDAATVGIEAGVDGVAEVPWDEAAARALRDGALKQGRLRRSALWRSLGSFSTRLATDVAGGPPPPARRAASPPGGDGHPVGPAPLPVGGASVPADADPTLVKWHQSAPPDLPWGER